jgi:hypothetical protein
LTTTSKRARIGEYLNVLDPAFTLEAAEVAAISVAGDTAPQRMYWLQCAGAFCKDPRKELQEEE